MTRKTAVIYARVSTVDQAEEELPIASQIERCKSKAAEIDASVLKVFTDEGRSGRNDLRQSFQDSISYCESFRTDYFIVWSTSRFARNTFDAALYKRRLDKVKTKLIYVSQPIDRESDVGWMMEGVFELFDEWYSRQIAADTLRSMQENARNGRWNGGNVPFGYMVIKDPANEKRKKLAPCYQEADIYREIFNLRESGQGSKVIANRLNQRGITLRGRKWTRSSILSLLKNQTCIGNIVFNRKNSRFRQIRDRDQWIIVRSHEPIIQAEQFERVQALLAAADMTKNNPASMRSNFVFTGLLRCGVCGSSMTTESASGRSRRYHYYNCRSSIVSSECKSRRITAKKFDDWLVDEILDKILTEKNLCELLRDINDHCGKWATDQRHTRSRIQTEISEIDGKRSKLYELMETFGKDTPNLSDVIPRLRKLNGRIKDLEAHLSAIDSAKPPEYVPTPSDLGEITHLLRDLIKNFENPGKIRQFFSAFIKKIELLDGSVTIEYIPENLLASAHNATVHSMQNWLPERGLSRTAKRIQIVLPERFRRVA